MGSFDEKAMLKKKKKMKKQEQERAEKRKNLFIKNHKTHPGINLFRFFETKTKSEFPWEEKGIHYGCGPDGKASFRCPRDNVDDESKGFDPIKKCSQCIKCQNLYDKGTKSSKAKAGRTNRKERILLEALDLTSLAKAFEEGKTFKAKECFGNFVFRESDEGFATCEKCVEKTSWGKVCQEGIGFLTIGPTLGGPMVSQAYKIHKSLKHNPFDPIEGHNFEFSRAGEELGTTYSDQGFSLESFKLPKVVRAFVEANALNWDEIYPKLSKDEMIAKIKGIEEEPEDEEEELDEEKELDEEGTDSEEDEDSGSEDEGSEGNGNGDGEDDRESSDDEEEPKDDDDESEGDGDESGDDEEEEEEEGDEEDEEGGTPDDNESDDETEDNESEDDDEEEEFMREIDDELSEEDEEENSEEKEDFAKKLKAQAKAKKDRIEAAGKKKKKKKKKG